MPIIPSPSIIRNLMFYYDMFRSFFVVWLICQIAYYVIPVITVIILIKYSAYIPDNPNYRRNYDDTKVLPRNPFTEAPATMKQSEIDAQKNR